MTRAEVLHGARNAADRQNLLTVLSTFQQLSIPDPVWDAVGDCLAALRAGGVTLPFQDAVLAVLAMHFGIEVWTRDKQFLLIQRAFPSLKLFQEPP